MVLGDLALRLVATVTLGLGGGLDAFGTALVGAGFGCVAGLLARRAPVGALAAAAAATSLAALDVVGIAQGQRIVLPAMEWSRWLGLAELALLAAAGVAGATVTVAAGSEAGRGPRLVLAAAIAGVCAVGVLGALALLQVAESGAAGVADPAGLRTSGRAALGLSAAAIVLALGLAGRAPVGRARAAASEASPSAGSGSWVSRFARALGAELAGRPSRGQVADEERARLAADIHARLLPGLRRAALAANEPGVPASVAEGLRVAVSDAEALMEARESVILETFGLVAALEWLAERTEERDRVEVAIDLDDPPLAEPPPVVARAVFRVAMLAIDNAVRHGRPTRIEIAIHGDPTHRRLTLADDGLGISRGAGSSAGRGIRDMRELARSIGGRLEIGPASQDGGTRVDLEWPAPAVTGNPAMEARATTDGGHAARR